MVNHQVAIFLYRNAIALFCAASIGISPAVPQKWIASPPSVARNDGDEIDILIRTRLWHYLRKGLNYLEASGKEVPVGFKHPGGKAYGPLGLSPIAIKDVQNHRPSLARYKFEDVLSDPEIYEKFAYSYADLLLRYYLKIDYIYMPREEVFDILQRAWFLGPTLYGEGRPIIASRQTKAEEYLSKS